jgi:predicted RNA-binding Zn ribbon-like protein
MVELGIRPDGALPDPALCLAFTNTVNWHGVIGRHADQWVDWPNAANYGEHLKTYRDLVDWALARSVLSPGAAKRLLRAAARRPDDAQTALHHAVALREAIYRALSAIAEGEPPDPADLAVLNAAIPEALQHLRLVYAGQRLDWEWAGTDEVLDRPLWPIVRSAADLLTSDALGRVRECDNDPCGWLFLDTSRNRSRRWCSMEGCGNRAKARRHYLRLKAARS